MKKRNIAKVIKEHIPLPSFYFCLCGLECLPSYHVIFFISSQKNELDHESQ